MRMTKQHRIPGNTLCRRHTRVVDRRPLAARRVVPYGVEPVDKKKNIFREIAEKIFLSFLSLSRSRLWVAMWVQTETAEIAQYFQLEMADKPSASADQPQHQRQQQSAEKQAYNSDNYDLD